MAMGKDQELFDMWAQIAGNPSEIYTSEFIKQLDGEIELDTDHLLKFIFSDINAFQKAGLLFKFSRQKSVQRIAANLSKLKALADYSPLMDKIKKFVSIDAVKSEVFKAGFVSLTDGNYYSPSHFDYKTDADFQKGVMASADIPIFWKPVEQIATHNQITTQLVDGGLRNATPFEDAVKYINDAEDADYHFLVISCHTGRIEKMADNPSLLAVAKRSLEGVISSEMQQSDLSEFLRVNQLVKQAESKGIELFASTGRKLRAFKIRIVQPVRELGFALDFSRNAILHSFSHGFQQAKRILQTSDWE